MNTPSQVQRDSDEPDDAAESDFAYSARVALDLVPGLRERLLIELDEANIPPRRRITEMCRLSGRARPSAGRWLDADEPGLPDLDSFTRLCLGLKVDANYLLGLVEPRLRLADATDGAKDEGWIDELRRTALRTLGGSTPYVMRGDDMAPRIKEGDVLFVDRRITSLQGNGVYLIEWQGRTMVRVVEDRLEHGLLLRCANSQYADVALPAAEITRDRLRLLGKVMQALTMVSMY
jgi:hypothetical protein